MKTTLKIMTAIVLASTAIASQASAATLGQERLADRNASYFQQSGHQSMSNAIDAESTYDTATSPQQRLGQRNAEYWASMKASKTAAPSSTMSEPMSSHPTKR